MRQVVNGKRTRGRSGRSKPSNPRNHTYDSSGPEGKVRGTANQVFEKYLALARDAQSSGDRIGAENFFQHAEHYFRIMNGFNQNDRTRPQGNGAARPQAINGHVGDRRAAGTAESGERKSGGEAAADQPREPERKTREEGADGSPESEKSQDTDSAAPEAAET